MSIVNLTVNVNLLIVVVRVIVLMTMFAKDLNFQVILVIEMMNVKQNNVTKINVK